MTTFSGWRGACVVAVDALCSELVVVSVVADRVPASSFFAGEGVEAVVRDDVETVFLLHDVGHALGIRFAGSAPNRAVVEPDAIAALDDFDPFVVHHRVIDIIE